MTCFGKRKEKLQLELRQRSQLWVRMGPISIDGIPTTEQEKTQTLKQATWTHEQRQRTAMCP
jgi:hypothetical protein